MCEQEIRKIGVINKIYCHFDQEKESFKEVLEKSFLDYLDLNEKEEKPLAKKEEQS